MDMDIDSKVLFDAVQTSGAERKPFVVEGAWPDGQTRFAIPKPHGGWEVEAVDDPNKAPDRIRARPAFLSLDSFVSYVKEHQNTNGVKTQIFADPDKLEFVAPLDYHAADKPSLVTHWAHYKPRVDVIFAQWQKVHAAGKLLQADFARFIEEHAVEIKDPNPADVLELAQDLNLKVDIAYTSRERLQNGLIGINYTETIQGNAATKGGQFQIPEQLDVSMPIFFGGDVQPFKVMLRYYPERNKPLTFALQIHRLEYEIEAAFLALQKRISEAVGLEPLIGRVTG